MVPGNINKQPHNCHHIFIEILLSWTGDVIGFTKILYDITFSPTEPPCLSGSQMKTELQKSVMKNTKLFKLLEKKCS